MTETTNITRQDSKGFIQIYKSTDEIPCEVWFAPKAERNF